MRSSFPPHALKLMATKLINVGTDKLHFIPRIAGVKISRIEYRRLSLHLAEYDLFQNQQRYDTWSRDNEPNLLNFVRQVLQKRVYSFLLSSHSPRGLPHPYWRRSWDARVRFCSRPPP